jgi:hypothetical protein
MCICTCIYIHIHTHIITHIYVSIYIYTQYIYVCICIYQRYSIPWVWNIIPYPSPPRGTPPARSRAWPSASVFFLLSPASSACIYHPTFRSPLTYQGAHPTPTKVPRGHTRFTSVSQGVHGSHWDEFFPGVMWHSLTIWRLLYEYYICTNNLINWVGPDTMDQHIVSHRRSQKLQMLLTNWPSTSLWLQDTLWIFTDLYDSMINYILLWLFLLKGSHL